MTDWNQAASNALRAELAKKNTSYKKLALQLEKIGVFESERAIANKLSRGTFSFVFFLQCMKALGRPAVEINLVDIDLDIPERRVGGAARPSE